MEFPHHHHHRRNDSDNDEPEEGRRNFYPPPDAPPPHRPPHRNPGFDFDQPPPPHYYQSSGPDYPPPPPQHYQSSEADYPPPPPQHYQSSEADYPPPPRPRYRPQEEEEEETSYGRPQAHVAHVSHDGGAGAHQQHHHLPSFLPHHEGGGAPPSTGLDLSGKPTYKVYSKAEPNFHLTIREGKVVLAASDPSDQYQNWYKDEKYSTRVKDEEGFPCFALVNKATGQAIKHSVGASHPVQLIPYNPDILDESVLWTQGKDLGDGYRTMRMVNNVRLNFDAFHGDKKSGGVHDGTTVVLWAWNKGDNQRWKIVPHCKFYPSMC